MKVKTQDLSGAALDWAVAKCEDGTTNPLAFVGENRSKITESWATCGPIIEREIAKIERFSDALWEATAFTKNAQDFVQNGPDPLVAAMRCFVASKLGDEVDVPNEFYCQTTPNT